MARRRRRHSRADRAPRDRGRVAARAMSIAARLVGAIWLAALVVTGGFTYFQVSEERRRLFDDMERRAAALGEGLKEAAEPALARGSRAALDRLPRKLGVRGAR